MTSSWPALPHISRKITPALLVLKKGVLVFWVVCSCLIWWSFDVTNCLLCLISETFFGWSSPLSVRTASVIGNCRHLVRNPPPHDDANMWYPPMNYLTKRRRCRKNQSLFLEEVRTASQHQHCLVKPLQMDCLDGDVSWPTCTIDCTLPVVNIHVYPVAWGRLYHFNTIYAVARCTLLIIGSRSAH